MSFVLSATANHSRAWRRLAGGAVAQPLGLLGAGETRAPQASPFAAGTMESAPEGADEGNRTCRCGLSY